MKQVDKTTGAALRSMGLVAGVVVLFACSLAISSPAPGTPDQPGPSKEKNVPQAQTAQLTVRGPNEAYVGRPFTLEVIIANPGAVPLKDLQFLTVVDDNVQHQSKNREHTEAIESIAAENLHIVRMTLTAKKRGPAGVDFTLRDKSGNLQQIRHVLPVFPQDDAPAQAERPAGSPSLKVTITSPKDCFAGKSGMYLLHVQNLDNRPTPKQDLVVVYGANSNGNGLNVPLGGLRRFNKSSAPPIGGGPGGPQLEARIARPFLPQPSNPIREIKVTLPAMGANESRTLPVVLMPGRIGDFRVSVNANNQIVGTTVLQAKFDPNATVESLLPTALRPDLAPRLPKTLNEVMEISLQDKVSRTTKIEESFEGIAHLIDKINHVNTKKMDTFVEGLLAHRPDLGGLPFAMGDSCRLQPERRQQFLTELTQLRAALANPHGVASRLPNPAGNAQVEKSTPARIAAMTQVLGPETVALRLEMVKYLATLSHVEATRALAKLAVFSPEDQVRRGAVDALKTRREKDYTDILVSALSYPWPAVAQNAGAAIVRLKRHDLTEQLIDTLDRPDPRSPQTREVDGKQVTVVREMVRVNHLRNCILCHQPRTSDINPAQMLQGLGVLPGGKGGGIANIPGGQPVSALLAQVPIPNNPLPPQSLSSGGYGQFSIPDTLIRFDVTYLRQDFSVMLPVADSAPWPQSQRFDFLVRTRVVTDKDAQAYRDLLRPAGAGDLSPYQRAAVTALRELTGRDAEPSAPAWRKLINQIRTEGGKG